MKLSKILALILSIVILILIIKGIGINNLINILKRFNLIYLPLIVIIMLIDHILAGLNTWFIASSFRKVQPVPIIKYTFITLVYAAITPGKLADLLMIPLLKKQRLTLSQSTITVGIDKIISLFVKAIFGLIGSIFILKKFDLLFFGVPLIALFIVIFLVLIFKYKIGLNFLKYKLLKKYSFLFRGFSKDIKNYYKRNKKYVSYNFIVTIIKTFLEALLFFLLFLAFGQSTDIIIIFFMFSLLSVIMLLTFPIGISGLGIRELIGIIIFGAVGVNSAVVFNSFIVRLVLVYLINLFTINIFKEELNFLKDSKMFKKFKF